MLGRFSLIILVLLLGCKNQKTERVPVKIDSKTYFSFGDTFEANQVLTVDEVVQNIEHQTDTMQVTLKGTIKEVCSKKGCWMTLPLANGDEVMVRFKDYGFFMPLDAKGEVIINGKAYLSETSVADLQHYAEDSGASEEDIAAITSPKKTYNFEADGVLLAK